MNAFDCYRNLRDYLHKANPHWRRGQCAFNALYMVAPALANSLRAGPLDPYHDDHLVEPFETTIKTRWHLEAAA
jgi:hypothetical protein